MVCMVGEWRGDTGDVMLEAQLLSSFQLMRRVPLPNWTDTVHELTVWERTLSRAPALDAGFVLGPCGGVMPEEGLVPLQPVSCSSCGAVSSGGVGFASPPQGEEGQPHGGSSGRASEGNVAKRLRRCRYCREVAYCCVACAETDSARHADLHALRLIFFENHEPHVSSDADFVTVSL